jgi:hypothetical protein
VQAAGIPGIGTDGDGIIEVGWHADLAGVVEEIQRIVNVLREWWPDLEVRTLLSGSAGAAHAAARRDGVRLPR